VTTDRGKEGGKRERRKLKKKRGGAHFPLRFSWRNAKRERRKRNTFGGERRGAADFKISSNAGRRKKEGKETGL